MLTVADLDPAQVRKMADNWHMFAKYLCADCTDLSDECPGCTLDTLVDALEAANAENETLLAALDRAECYRRKTGTDERIQITLVFSEEDFAPIAARNMSAARFASSASTFDGLPKARQSLGRLGKRHGRTGVTARPSGLLAAARGGGAT